MLGPRPEHDSALEVIATWPTPAVSSKAGPAQIDARPKAHGAKRHALRAQAIIDALTRQTVTVAGTDAAGAVLPHLARRLIALHAQRADIAGRAWALAGGPPSLARPLTTRARHRGSRPPQCSWPRPRARPSPPGPSSPPTPGLAPLTRRPGSSIRGEHTSHAGNKRLKRAMFGSAFASLRPDPVSRAYYQRERDQGKRPGQAVLALAHRRILTLNAMIPDAALYDPQPAAQPPTTA